MKKTLLILISIMLYSSLSLAQSNSYTVNNVAISGNLKTDATALNLQLEARAGQVSKETIDKDIKTLFGTGFFEQVQASIVKDKQGRSTLRYSVTEKPIVRKVFVQGNKDVKKDDIEQALDFRAGRFLDSLQIKRATERIVSYYRGRGYYDIKVDSSIIPAGPNQVDITFQIDEGDKYKIKGITFSGLKVLDESVLLNAMQTKTYKWWNSWLLGTGRLNPEMLENDKNILRQELINNGLIEGTIGEPNIKKEDKGLYLSFHVNEGDLYHIGTISASGDLIDNNEEKTVSDISSKSGDVFNGSKIRSDALTISDKFSDIGYAFANVVPNTQIDKDNLKVNVNFSTSKGNLVTVNRINIRGNNKTYDNVVRRDMVIAEQDTFSSSQIRRSQELIQRRGYFEEVNIITENTDKDDTVNLAVNVKEGSTGTVSVGAGFSSSDGAIFNARLSENNVLGTGRRINLEVDVGDKRDNITLSFSDPRVYDTQWSLGLDVFKNERVFDDFDSDQLGASLIAGYSLEELFGRWSRDTRFSLKYKLVETEINDIDDDAAELVKAEAGESLVSSITPAITRNTINNPLDPTNGSRQTVSLEIAGLGGDKEFALFEAVNQIYYPVYKLSLSEIVFSWRTRFGYGETFNDDSFPLFQRYFPGGINSVRGFKARRLGPKDLNGKEFGGSKQLVNNMEFIFPIASSAGLKGVVFYDFGQAYDDDQSIDLSELRHAAGYGIRWSSPLGPIRVEFGYPLDREEGESAFVTQFSFGAPF